MSDAFRQAIEDIKLKCPIEDVVRERVATLKQAGALWVACCPFHEEKTPSFKVDPRRGTWHCYGACGTGGDQISFVERSYNVEFREALEILAGRAGVVLPSRGSNAREDQRRYGALYDALERAEGLYRKQLRGPRGREALEYLRGRGLSDGTLDAFGVGLALAGRGSRTDTLAARAARRDVPLEVLEGAGLVRRRDDGSAYDFFRERITFPVRDLKGRTVGFGARRLVDDDPRVPKYVNTSETPLFRKGQLVYGLDRALAHARREGRLTLVEGYTDVMAAHQVGIPTVVAVLGTSTTDEHAALVRRAGARRVDLVFDGDEAGRRATLRALHGLLPIDVALRIVRLPGGSDPCEFVMEHGAEAFQAELDRGPDWFEHLSAEVAGLPRGERWRAADELLALVARLPRPLQRDEHLELLAERLGIPVAGVREQFESLPERRREARRKAEAERSRAAARRATTQGDGPEVEAPTVGGRDPGRVLTDHERLVAAVVLLAEAPEDLGGRAERCPDDELRRILDAIVDLRARGVRPDLDAVLCEISGDPARDRVVDLVDFLSLSCSDVTPRGLLAEACHNLDSQEQLLRIEEQSLDIGDAITEQARLAELHRELRARVI